MSLPIFYLAYLNLDDKNIGGDFSGTENGFALTNCRFKRRVLILSPKKELLDRLNVLQEDLV